MHHLRNVLVLLACIGCGGDVVTTASLEEVALLGSWQYSTTSDAGSRCTASGVTLTFTKQGTALSGTYAGGILTCSGSSTPFGNGTLGNVAILATGLVTFEIKNYHNNSSSDFSHSAIMRGEVFTNDTPNLLSRFPLNGAFLAVKQP